MKSFFFSGCQYGSGLQATGPVGKVLTRFFFDAMVSAMFASLNRTLYTQKK